jgi:predicted nucleic acid-binding protein
VIAYFDTSAVVPLLVVEAGSARAAALWDGADRVVSARLVYPEGRAALAQARRLGRLTARQLRAAVTEFDSRYEEFDLVEVDDTLARHAGRLAEAHGLRGYDAVHLAAADRLRDPDLVVVAGNKPLLSAASAEGMTTATVG